MTRILTTAMLALLAAGVAIPADAQQERKRRCDAYIEQFDAQRERYREHPDYDVARRYRLLGEKYCNTGYNSAGQTVLKHAIDMLGARPQAQDNDQDTGDTTRTFRTY